MAAIPGARSGAAMYVEHKNTIRDGRSTAYKLLTLLTLFTLLTLLTLFILLKLLYTATALACMPVYIVWEG